MFSMIVGIIASISTLLLFIMSAISMGSANVAPSILGAIFVGLAIALCVISLKFDIKSIKDKKTRAIGIVGISFSGIGIICGVIFLFIILIAFIPGSYVMGL